jgi:pyruvate kinase
VKLFDAGMTMARINLSHGSMKQNSRLIHKFKEAKRLRPHKTCALMLETRGREIRISNFESGSQRIRSGSNVALVIDEYQKASTDTQLRINNNVIQRFLKPNDVIYIDDGKVVGIVIEVSAKEVKMEIKIGGTIKSNCNVRFTGGKHGNLELVTKEDIADIAAYSQLIMIDYIAIPFVNSGADPMTVKELLGPKG